jgi:F-type H+-transporting ATPase subunit delta
VTNKAAANRYARALLDVVVKEKLVDPQVVETQLAGVVGLFERHRTLKSVLLNPAVPAPRKRAVVEALAKTTVAPVVAKLLALLAERDRLVILPDLLAAYRERLLDHLRVVRAELTTAVTLPDDRAEAVERILAALTGRSVAMATRLDPSIIGGVVARIGNTVYDGSITGQLQRIKEKLSEI